MRQQTPTDGRLMTMTAYVLNCAGVNCSTYENVPSNTGQNRLLIFASQVAQPWSLRQELLDRLSARATSVEEHEEIRTALRVGSGQCSRTTGTALTAIASTPNKLTSVDSEKTTRLAFPESRIVNPPVTIIFFLKCYPGQIIKLNLNGLKCKIPSFFKTVYFFTINGGNKIFNKMALSKPKFLFLHFEQNWNKLGALK